MKFLQSLQTLGGVVIALLLLMAGLSGAFLAFYYEVDEVLNPSSYRPSAYHVEPASEMLPPPVLIDRLEQARPEVQVWYLQYPWRADETAMATAQPRPDASGNYPEIPSDVFYLDPYSAEIVSERFWGRCCLEGENFLNFIYEVHHSLKRGDWGGYLMGLAALVLLGNCLLVLWQVCSGPRSMFGQGQWLYLLPLRSRSLAALFALLLLPIAVSSVAMNLAEQVFKPVVSVFSPVQPTIYEEYEKKAQSDFGERVLSYGDAWKLAQDYGRERNWPEPVAELFYSSSYNFYGMAFGHRDPDGMGNNWIYLDGVDGHVVGDKTPREGTAGDYLTYLQLPIHSGRLAGLPSKTAISLLGLMAAFLSCLYMVRAVRDGYKSGR